MRRPCCHTCLAFLLKFLNFLQFFIGVCMVIYSVYMLNHWQRHHHHQQHGGDGGVGLFAADVSSGFDSGLEFNLHSVPAPWFIYAFMGVGIASCCITCIGHIGAEALSGWCLCFYALLSVVFILLEVSFVAFIALDHSWEKDLPLDPTGELDSLRNFIQENMDICMWVGIAVITIQVLSLLLAIILRALVSSQRAEDDEEEVYIVRGRPWEPVNPHSSQTSASTTGDGKVSLSDIWSSRMREKYGLNNNDARYSLLNQNSSIDSKAQQ